MTIFLLIYELIYYSLLAIFAFCLLASHIGISPIDYYIIYHNSITFVLLIHEHIYYSLHAIFAYCPLVI